jgi:hypothetical protein
MNCCMQAYLLIDCKCIVLIIKQLNLHTNKDKISIKAET